MKRPKGWRKGQMIENFTFWMTHEKGFPHLFYITDKDFNKYWKKYLKYIKEAMK